MDKKLVVLLTVILVVVIAAVWWKIQKQTVPPSQASCTMEAKVCPDGSSVGRSGPKCEFAACPSLITDPSWKTFSDPEQRISFKYPETFGTKYISLVDWPPKINFEEKQFSCTQAGNENGPAGATKEIIVNNHMFCQTIESEGAAGSTYNQYAYAFQEKNGQAILTFTLLFVQCANFDEPQMSECQKETDTFDINSVIDKIAESVQFNN